MLMLSGGPSVPAVSDLVGQARPLGEEPEFCPNPECRFHNRSAASGYQWYVRYGRFSTRARGAIQRFRCIACGKTCSTQTFSIHYWTHATNDLAWLLGYLGTCSGIRQAARIAGVTHRVIQNRCRRLARNALMIMDCALAELTLREHLAFDGFESFTRSQYHPNNITHFTGADSQFVYAAVHTLFRRKGTMRTSQRSRRALIDTIWRPATTVSADTAELLADLAPPIDAACRKAADSGSRFTLRSDCHPAYPKAIGSVATLAARLADGSLHHQRTSSRAARCTSNPLFPVNYVDRQLRSVMAEYVRETIRQGREVNSQMERMAIFMALHNFATPHRIDGRARVADALTHAEIAGIGSPTLDRALSRMLTHRHLYSHTTTGHHWIRRIWLHEYGNPPAVRLRAGRLIERPVALPAFRMPRYLMA